jgi:hypothetical protein
VEINIDNSSRKLNTVEFNYGLKLNAKLEFIVYRFLLGVFSLLDAANILSRIRRLPQRFLHHVGRGDRSEARQEQDGGGDVAAARPKTNRVIDTLVRSINRLQRKAENKSL